MTSTQANALVSTSQYQFSHSHAPRGVGYWGFEFTFSKRSGLKPSQFWVTAAYGEAKRRALRQAQLWEFGGVQSIIVLP